MVNDIAVEEFVNAIKDTPTDPNTTYNATVSHIDKEGIVWVNIHGSNKETPTASTSAEVKNGDVVTVQWRNNKLYIGGNYTNPSAGVDTVTPAVDYVSQLVDKNITVNNINAASAYIGDLTSKNITAESLSADHAMIKELDVESMSAATAYIRDLTSENITAQDIIADHETVGTLDATYATIDELHSDYAEIDLANVNNAWIQNGVVKDAAISDAQIIGVSANKLTAGTIDASSITVTNLNADNITTGTINGQRIGSESITLDKLAEEVPTKAYLDNIAENLQGQIDGQIETWTGTAVPTLNNSPASAWTTADERHKHVGDIYYVVNAGATADGYTYRFTESGTTTKTYSWTLIKDNQITKALQDILDMQGDISDIQTFDSQISSWKTDTDEELGSLKSRTSTLETGMGNKVDTTTFNELSQTVDENSANITSLTTTVSNKADSSTVTTLSNTVNSVSQKADSNSSTISQLTTTLGTNADGTTKTGDIVHRTSAVEQDLSGFHTTVAETYATKASVNGKADASTVYTKSEIDQTVSGINASVSAKADGASTTAALALKANKDTLTSEINASADTVQINANRVNIEGAAIFTGSGRLSTTSLGNTYDAKWAASTAESNAKGYADGLASDLQDEIDAKKSVHTLTSAYLATGSTYANILVYAKEGQSTTFTVLDYSSENVKIGDSVRIAYAVSDMNKAIVYINGTVTAMPSSTSITITGHGLDTTIIDGGNILTNSIGANQIAANAIDTSKLTVGTQNDVLNSNVQVGGTNLLLNSKLRKSGSSNGVSFAASTLGSEYILISGTATATVDEYIADLQYLTAYAGCTVTISANYVPSGYFYVSTSKDGAWYKDYREITWYSNTERRLTITLESGESLRYLRLHLDSGQTISSNYRFKVEVGNKQTQWSPAPEDAEKSYYGSCETAAATAAKVVTCDGFTLKVGTIIGVRFTNGNTCTTAITLNVNGTGVRTVLLSGYSTGTAERFNLNLAAYATVSFVYDGTYWRTIGIDQTSTMITRIDNTGISIHPNGTSDHRAEITSSGMNIYKGGVSVAQYADTARVGPVADGYARTLVNTGGMQVVQRNSSGTDITMANIGYGSGNAESGTNTTPYYTLGTRKSGVAVGNYSLAAGVENEAVKYSSATIGEGLVSTNNDQTVVGRYNDRLLGVNSLFVVGDGTSDSNRSTAFEVETGGDVIAKGGITVEGHSSAIGATTSSYLTSSKAITAGTATYLCSISLTAGTWVITGVVQFPNASDTTYRRMKIKAGSSSSAEPPDVQVAALNGAPTTITATIIEYVSSNTTYYLNVMAGKACTMAAGGLGNYNYMKAVRIA